MQGFILGVIQPAFSPSHLVWHPKAIKRKREKNIFAEQCETFGRRKWRLDGEREREVEKKQQEHRREKEKEKRIKEENNELKRKLEGGEREPAGKYKEESETNSEKRK